MNKQAFIELLKNPDTMNASDLKGLEEVIQNYPYFQAAHLLAAKGFKDQGKMLAEQKVRKAAAYAGERAGLKKLLAKFKNGNTKDKNSKEPSISSESAKIKELKEIPLRTPLETKADSAAPVFEQPTSAITQKDSFSPEQIENTVIKKEEKNDIAGDIQETLNSLRETRKKLSETFTENINIVQPEKATAKEESEVPQILEEEIKEATIITSQESKDEKASDMTIVPETKTDLIPEKIKEHNQEDLLFSSRLDEVITNSGNSDRAKSIDEGDLLLNYLSFLEMSKKTVKDKKKTEEIIEKFIKEDPTIPPLSKSKLSEEQEDKASGSYTLKSSPLSENMAKIFLLQGKKEKAIEIYNQLILKYPEKKDYFASQIEKIK